MIPFDIKLQLKILRLHIKNKGFGRITLFYLFIFLPFISMNYLFHQFFFFLDELLFFSYRSIETDRSMFIIGPPRCGTSLFLDMLNKSSEITSMRAWELIFAPSICLKLFYRLMGKLDHLLGTPLTRAYIKLHRRQNEKLLKVHDTSLLHYEEDAMLFYHTGNAPFYLFVFPFVELIELFTHFDEFTSPKYKARYMKYYKRCIQKHLFVFGRRKTYLSKNPFFSLYVKTLREHFDDAKFIYMIRTPYQVVPSAFSLATISDHWTRYADPEAYSNGIIEVLKQEYAYPLETLNFEDEKHNVMIQYEDLISNPQAMVEKIHDQFKMHYSDELKRSLSETAKRKKKFVSKNKYSLDKYNLSESQIKTHFKDIFSSLGFEKEGI